MGTSTAEHIDNTGPVQEHYYRRGDIDFCFLLNRRHHNLRVFDYRVGNYQQKRDFFDRIARTEELRKVFTVVEKQDSKSWRSVGFSREGAIPGYFRTADAYIMSRVYTAEGDPIQGGAPKLNAPNVSAKKQSAGKPRGLCFEFVRDQAKLDRAAESLGHVALYAPFRRAVFRPDLALHAKLGKQNYWVGAETDASFGHAKVDVLTPPKTEDDLAALEFCMQSLLDELLKIGTASVFALCAADWDESSCLYGNLGFKVTARLTDHITRKEDFVGAQLWHRRIGSTNPPRLPSFI
ncbi:MAG: hypothetical protein V3V08_21495 [Nannocystaceae bacterium]